MTFFGLAALVVKVYMKLKSTHVNKQIDQASNIFGIFLIIVLLLRDLYYILGWTFKNYYVNMVTIYPKMIRSDSLLVLESNHRNRSL